MVVQTNSSATNATRNLFNTNTALKKSTEKLSSGFRINRAGDDAAGLAISEKMKGQISGSTMASKNAQDGISLIQTAEGYLSEVQSMLQRIRELEVQAENDTNTQEDRENIQLEVDQLLDEIDAISTKAEFNTKKLLDGTYSKNSTKGSGNAQTLKDCAAKMMACVSALQGSVATLTASKGALEGSAKAKEGSAKTKEASAAAKQASAAAKRASAAAKTDQATAKESTAQRKEDLITTKETLAEEKEATGTVDGANSAAALKKCAATLKDSVGKLTASAGKLRGSAAAKEGSAKAKEASAAAKEASAAVKYASAATKQSQAVAKQDTIDVKNDEIDDLKARAEEKMEQADALIAGSSQGNSDGLMFQVGANAGQTITVGIQAMNTKVLGIRGIDVTKQTTNDGKSAALNKIDNALNIVSKQRAELGAVQNRLEHTVSNLDNAVENMEDANSRIRDTNMAKEIANNTKLQTLLQVNNAMLAQANQNTQNVLSLLQ